MSDKVYKIEDTQRIIQRFAWQSFGIKGFSFTFLGLISEVIYAKQSLLLIAISIVSVLVFWYLDAYYLNMERIYRNIEKEGITKGLNYKEYPNIEKSNCLCRSFFSRTIASLYIIQILFILISCSVH